MQPTVVHEVQNLANEVRVGGERKQTFLTKKQQARHTHDVESIDTTRANQEPIAACMPNQLTSTKTGSDLYRVTKTVSQDYNF